MTFYESLLTSSYAARRCVCVWKQPPACRSAEAERSLNHLPNWESPDTDLHGAYINYSVFLTDQKNYKVHMRWHLLHLDAWHPRTNSLNPHPPNVIHYDRAIKHFNGLERPPPSPGKHEKIHLPTHLPFSVWWLMVGSLEVSPTE